MWLPLFECSYQSFLIDPQRTKTWITVLLTDQIIFRGWVTGRPLRAITRCLITKGKIVNVSRVSPLSVGYTVGWLWFHLSEHFIIRVVADAVGGVRLNRVGKEDVLNSIYSTRPQPLFDWMRKCSTKRYTWKSMSRLLFHLDNMLIYFIWRMIHNIFKVQDTLSWSFLNVNSNY